MAKDTVPFIKSIERTLVGSLPPIYISTNIAPTTKPH